MLWCVFVFLDYYMSSTVLYDGVHDDDDVHDNDNGYGNGNDDNDNDNNNNANQQEQQWRIGLDSTNI